MDKSKMIQRLKQNKANTMEFSAFSENNHAAIDAMIKTLEKGLSEDDVYDYFPTKHEQDSAMDILAVLAGEIELEEALFPENAKTGITFIPYPGEEKND